MTNEVTQDYNKLDTDLQKNDLKGFSSIENNRKELVDKHSSNNPELKDKIINTYNQLFYGDSPKVSNDVKAGMIRDILDGKLSNPNYIGRKLVQNKIDGLSNVGIFRQILEDKINNTTTVIENKSTVIENKSTVIENKSTVIENNQLKQDLQTKFNEPSVKEAINGVNTNSVEYQSFLNSDFVKKELLPNISKFTEGETASYLKRRFVAEQKKNELVTKTIPERLKKAQEAEPNAEHKMTVAELVQKDPELQKDLEFVNNFNSFNSKIGLGNQFDIKIDYSEIKLESNKDRLGKGFEDNKSLSMKDVVDEKNIDAVVAGDPSLKNYTDKDFKMTGIDKELGGGDNEYLLKDREFAGDILSVVNKGFSGTINGEKILKDGKNITILKKDLSLDPGEMDKLNPNLKPQDKEAIFAKINEQIGVMVKNKIDGIKNNSQEASTEVVKEKVMASCITNFGKCFDSTNVHLENSAYDFNINKDGIKCIDRDGEKELVVEGSMQGKKVVFCYNLSEGNVYVSDILAQKGGSDNSIGSFDIGNKENRQLLPMTLPKLEDTENAVVANVERSASSNFNEAKKSGDFSKNTLKSGLMKDVPLYKPETLLDGVNKTCVEYAVQKTIALQESFDVFKNVNNGEVAKNVEGGEKKDIGQFYNILDRSMDHYTPRELGQYRQLLSKFDALTSADWVKNYERGGNVGGKSKKFAKMFGGNDKEEKVEDLSKFFDKMTYGSLKRDMSSIIDLNKFQKTMDALSKEKFDMSDVHDLGMLPIKEALDMDEPQIGDKELMKAYDVANIG